MHIVQGSCKPRCVPIPHHKRGFQHYDIFIIPSSSHTLLHKTSCTHVHNLPCSFSQFLQFRTVSSPFTPHHVVEPEEFQRLHAWLPRAYPEVWEAMEVEEVRGVRCGEYNTFTHQRRFFRGGGLYEGLYEYTSSTLTRTSSA